jgi:hypothetical protein
LSDVSNEFGHVGIEPAISLGYIEGIMGYDLVGGFNPSEKY